jgi:hypothetical protein
MVAALWIAGTAMMGAVEVWVPGAMDKVLPSALPPEQPAMAAALDLAANEYEGFQIAVRADAPLTALRVSAEALAPAEGTEGKLLPAEVFLVGTVPLTRNSPLGMPEAASDLIAHPGDRVPDPIPPWPAAGSDLAAGETRCAYLRVHTPADAAPGEYRSTVTLRWQGGEAAVPVTARVWPVVIPEQRHLAYTNWISHEGLAERYKVELWSDEFCRIAARYAREAHAHRQTALWVPWTTIRVSRAADGALTCDFSGFDRWVEMCEAEGVCDQIEIQPLGACDRESATIPLGDWTVTDAEGSATSAPARDVLPTVLPALEKHLAQRGWLERTLLHIADEPFVQSVEPYRAVSSWIHSLAPGIRRIDAIEAPDFGDSLDVWVPKLTHYNHWMADYQAAQARGAEVWFYTCCHPYAPYPNRFLDMPLVATRVLHWINWRYAMPGYLHWGLNFWAGDPWESEGPEGLPPGDCWILYPGEEGPVSSLRYEAVRDGIEDYELLRLLGERTRGTLSALGAPEGVFHPSRRADEIAAAVVPTIIDWPRDPNVLLGWRRAVLAELSDLSARPVLYIETDPPTSNPLTPGPIAVAVRGIAEKGATVTANGERVFPQADGTFVAHVFPSHPPVLEVTARLGDQTRTIRREWPVAKPRAGR